jgi:hypothetical protein
MLLIFEPLVYYSFYNLLILPLNYIDEFLKKKKKSDLRFYNRLAFYEFFSSLSLQPLSTFVIYSYLLALERSALTFIYIY